MSSPTAAAAAAAAIQHVHGTVPIWDMNQTQSEAWLRSTRILLPPPPSQDPTAQVGVKLTQNVLNAATSLLVGSNATTNEPPTKKLKTQQQTPSTTTSQPSRSIHDNYGIWTHSTDDEIPTAVGAVLVQLSLAGWINALAGQEGGVVTRKLQPLVPTTLQLSTPIVTACHATYQSIRKYALCLKQKIQTQMEHDFLIATPKRVHQMVCADLTDAEFRAIRKRVYDTVLLGKGMSSSSSPPEVVEDTSLAVARNKNNDAQAMDQYQKCKVCGNNDQSLFVFDQKNGDVICTNCGTIAMESIMHEGSQFRKFEGEIDRNHHGDARNSLYSDAHNLSTTLGGIQVTTGAGIGGYGSVSKKNLELVLRNAHSYTELNLSNFGKGDRRTRVGYKDRQKREAFINMQHVGDALNLHEAVVQRAKELFAGFRDDRELVQQFKGVIAACLCEAFDQLSRDGHQILKQREQDEGEALLNSRASRRNELHHANMAGKGGLLLDVSSSSAEGNGIDGGREKPPTPTSAAETKPAPSWDLDDCRSWLLEASQNIAQQWMEDRKKPNAPKNLPQGTQEELEGKLVEHTISLCDQLEAELKSRDGKASGVNKRVVTPRVNEMGRLGIKWQHKHERGSGGKGGVGNSGSAMGAKDAKAGAASGRTAGQIFILKTAKKLGAMLKDPVAGEAFHRELRALAARQEARKRKELSVEATRQRKQQMKRKPWLQARAQVGSS